MLLNEEMAEPSPACSRWWTVLVALGVSLGSACWPPEVSITGSPQLEEPVLSSPQASLPSPGPAQALPEDSPQPVVAAPPAPAPSAQQPDPDPCGLENTRCCPPANACAESLRCEPGSQTCVAAAGETDEVALPAPTYVLRFDPGPEQLQVGGDGGSPFSALCPSDQVLIGMRAVADENLWGLGVSCGRLLLSDQGDALSVLPLEPFAVFGGTVVIEPPPPLLEYACPPQMVVTAVSWTLWQPFSDPQDIVEQVQLTCSELSVGPDRLVRVGSPAAVLAAGAVGDSGAPVLQTCGEQGVVSGLTGRSGGAIDALSTSCVTLSVEVL